MTWRQCVDMFIARVKGKEGEMAQEKRTQSVRQREGEGIRDFALRVTTELQKIYGRSPEENEWRRVHHKEKFFCIDKKNTVSIQYRYSIDTVVSMQYRYSIDTVSTVSIQYRYKLKQFRSTGVSVEYRYCIDKKITNTKVVGKFLSTQMVLYRSLYR